MKAKKCDRCSKYEDRSGDLPDLQTHFVGIDGTDHHLCSDCKSDFKEWWKA